MFTVWSLVAPYQSRESEKNVYLYQYLVLRSYWRDVEKNNTPHNDLLIHLKLENYDRVKKAPF